MLPKFKMNDDSTTMINLPVEEDKVTVVTLKKVK